MNPSRQPQSNITPAHRDMFNAITGGNFNNFALFSCHVNGEPAAAIVAINQDATSGDYLVTPLFVSVTDGMALTDHDGTPVAAPQTPAWAKEILGCDTLEIHPVCDLNWNDEEQGPRPFKPVDDHDSVYETCDASQAHFWSVYGHLKTGGLTCLADFTTKAEAIAFADALYEAYPHLER